jgi:PAS domain S-box-containing protein/putative nucleotidyltransferase with HDIG domain
MKQSDHIAKLKQRIVALTDECAYLHGRLEALNRENQLLEQIQQQWAVTLDAVRDPVFVHDEKFRIVRANIAYANRAGMPIKDIIGKPYWQVFPKRKKESLPGYKSGTQEQNKGAEEDITLKTGEHFHSRSFYSKDDSGHYYVHILEDLNLPVAAVEQAKEEWEQTFDAVTDPIFLHDREFRIMRANRAYAEHAGMSIKEVIGRLYWEVFPKGNGPLPGCAKALAQEVEISCGNGSIYLSRSYPIRDKENNHSCSIHCMQDITKHKQTERKLEASETNFRNLVETDINALVVHRDFHLIYANPAAKKLFETAEGAAVPNKSVLDYVHPDYRNFTKLSIRRMIRRNRSISATPIKAVTPSGRHLDVEITSTPINFEHQQAVLSIIRDITDHKEAERALLQSEESLRNLVEADINALVVHRDFHLIYANPAAKKLFEAPEGVALPDISVLDYVHPDYRNFTRLSTRRMIRMNKSLEAAPIQMITPSGRQLDIEITSTPITFEHQQVVLSIIRDVTERKQSQEALERSHERLQQSLEGTIQAIASAVEARDPYTAGHQRRVAELSASIAHVMGLGKKKIEGIHWGAMIHDIGKINLPAEILSKPLRLTDIEYSLIRGHPQVGYDILKDIEFPWPVADIAHQHHERVDGSGYPQGLKGEGICLEARIVAVADVVEAMASHRPYRPGLGIDKALVEIKNGRGSRYDVEVVDACLKLFAEHRFSFEK